MITLLRLIFRALPWLLVVYFLIKDDFKIERQQNPTDSHTSNILTRIEEIGNLELVRYNFQEVTELKRLGDHIEFFDYKLKIMPDSKAVLISQGSAAGCIDLTQMSQADLKVEDDTLHIYLPSPELCYFKVDLEKSRLYDLDIRGLSTLDQKSFMQELYEVAENEIKESALQMGILEQTQANARRLLSPLLENISTKKIVLHFEVGREANHGKGTF